MEKELLDDIEILDDVEIVEEIQPEKIVDLMKEFDSSIENTAIYAGDLGLETVVEEPKKVEVVLPKIDLPEEIVVEDIMSKTYNLSEVVKIAKEETVVEKDEFDGRKSAIFIGLLFVVLVVFVIALPYITKLMIK